MFENILVPLDGSPMADRILPHVAAIAQRNDRLVAGAAPPSAITLLRVLETDAVESTAVDPLAWHFAKAEAQAHLDEAVKQLAQLGLASIAVLLEDGAALRIVEYAHKHSADLIALSSHGQGGLSGWNVSSVAQKVIHRAGTSILLVRSMFVRSSDESAEERGGGVDTEIIRYHRILAPLDGSQRAESVLPVASSLAELHSAELLVVHVVTRPEMIQHVPLSPEDAALAERVVVRNTTEAEKYFDQLQSRLPPKALTRVLVDDSVTWALHDLVEQEQADLVVLSAHGYSCHSQWLYSALVNSFITYGATSLLIMQDLPSNETRRAMVESGAADLTMPTRRANAQEGPEVRVHSEF
ncbi:MAG: universal stress protein [Candidatus Promineifilaceae bacterium]|jgi:nucleotide-binding universal stress UspA family protein